MGITSVTKKGQITIPADVRQALGIKEKDRILVLVEGDEAVIRKLPPLTELRGSIPVEKAKKGADWKKIEQRTAASRGQQGV